jgi:enamine deaminase RidA (YjgF/YER057c/UK114 family)
LKLSTFCWEDIGVEAQVSAFEAEFPEYHALLSLNGDPLIAGEAQFRSIEEGAVRLLEALPVGMGVAFKRYFVSDIVNQASYIGAGWELRPVGTSSTLLEKAGWKPTLLGQGAVSVVQQPPLSGYKVGLWLYIVSASSISRRAKSTVISHNGRRHIIHTGLYSEVGGSEAQTFQIFKAYGRELALEGCSIAGNCLRTWLYVRDIDFHYAGMTKARRELFADEGLTSATHFIASTGIEGRNEQSGVYVLMDAYAVKGLENGQIKYLAARERMNPTHEYGVTFERGTAIRYSDRTHVFISGTASIDERGQIVAPRDVIKQAERMMGNITALLVEAGANLGDIASMLIYLRDAADYQAINNYFSTTFPLIPKIILLAPICRSGWLIEAEVVAIV